MDESGKTDSQDNARRVCVPYFPQYRTVRHLLGVWPGRSKAQITKLHSTIIQRTGTPSEPVDWGDPDVWIPKKLPGEHHELAYAIWEGSDKTVNPRHTAGSWSLVRNYALLAEDSDGILQLTDRGHDFIDQAFGDTEALVDQQEGLIDLLGIVDDRGPARTAVFVEPWAELLLEVESPFRSESTIRKTLGRRLSNLRDRKLVTREGFDYSITEAGLDYLKRAQTANGVADLPEGVKKYADDEVGRTILNAVADSIEFADSLHWECWATRIDGSSHDLTFYVASAIMMRLHSSSKRVEITLQPEDLREAERQNISPASVTREYKWPEGARRYQLSWSDFVERWPSIRQAHRGVIKQAAVMKTTRAAPHRPAAVSFLNETLGRELPQPGYVVDRNGGAPGDVGFRELTKSLHDGGLLFSQELVANYILTLQTKRFAILTGISGTGKTKIAMAVAEHFRPTRQRIPADAMEFEVTHSHIKWSRIVLPVAIRSQLMDASAGVDQTTDRKIRVRYPAGHATLSYYWGDKAGKKSERLLFKGDFKEWFQSTFEVGDHFWLRVRPSETDDPDELEIGLPRTEVAKRPFEHYVVVPVRPDWVDNRGLLGYLNPLTKEYSTTEFLDLLLRARDEEKRAKAAGEKPHPFFVILDEMNLARVEHYFSDFLSALESGENIPLHKDEAIASGEPDSGPRVPTELKVPGNVLFTGTVNVDETTYMFSPKVLDRAFTLEFDQVDLQGFTEGASSEDVPGLNLDGAQGSLDLLQPGLSEDDDWKPSRDDWVEFSKETGEQHTALLRLHDILETQHRHFGYRVANEIARFVNLARQQAKDADTAVDAAFDLALLQKVLPKFHGTQQEMDSLLQAIFHFALFGGGHAPKKNQTVELNDWQVVKGRLVIRPKTRASSQPPSGNADDDGDDTDSDTAKAADTGTKSPVYPRTGAKVLRMLSRLRDRGFTSFIE